jgi:iron complex outermembrane recepter protein
VTGFYNDYEEVLAPERLSNIPEPGYTIWPNRWGNNLHGQTYGTEISATYQARDNWRLNAGYTFLLVEMYPDKPSVTHDEVVEGQAPHNQFQLRSLYDLSKDLELDFSLYYVDNVAARDVPHCLRFDLRLGWHMTENLELSVVGQNLFNKRHPGFGVEANQTLTEAEQGVYMKLSYQF